MTGYKYVSFSPDNYNLQSTDGIVRFKAPWNNSATTRKALDAVLKKQPANFRSYFKPATPWVVLSTAKRAGKGSGKDFFIGLPQLIWNVLIKNNIRTLLQ